MANYKLKYFDENRDVHQEVLRNPLDEVLDYALSLQDSDFRKIQLVVEDDKTRPEEYPARTSLGVGAIYNYRVCYTNKDGSRDEIFIDANSYEKDDLSLHHDIVNLNRSGASNIIVFQPSNKSFGDDIESFGHPIAIYNLQPDTLPLGQFNKYKFLIDAPETPNGMKYVDFVGTPQTAKETAAETHAVKSYDCGPTPEHVFLSKLKFDFTRLVDKFKEIGEYFIPKIEVKHDPVSDQHIKYIQNKVQEMFSKGKPVRLIKGSIRQYCNQFNLGKEFINAGNDIIRKTAAQQAR